MAKPEHISTEPQEHRIAREIFTELMPKWEGAIMLFKKDGRDIVIQGEEIMQLILESVREAKYHGR